MQWAVRGFCVHPATPRSLKQPCDIKDQSCLLIKASPIINLWLNISKQNDHFNSRIFLLHFGRNDDDDVK